MAARKEDETPPGVDVSCCSVLRFSLGRGDSVREEWLRSVRRTEPGLEAGNRGGSGGGWSAIFIKISSLHSTAGTPESTVYPALTTQTVLKDEPRTKVLSAHVGDHCDDQ